MTDVPRSSPYPMVSVDDAYEAIIRHFKPLRPVELPLDLARGHRLAEDVRAPTALPPFPASMKDGYALNLHAAQGRPFLRVAAAASLAGGEAPPPLVPGECAYITTGAPLPSGADAVVMVERTAPGPTPGTIAIERLPAASGADVRAVGSDIAAGERIFAAGAHLGAAEVGVLSGLAIRSVCVTPGPVVGVLSSGDELLDADGAEVTAGDTPLPFGKVVDSNRPMLRTAVKEAFPYATVLDCGILHDSDAEFEAKLLEHSSKCNLLVTSGGISMGSHDLVKPTLEKFCTVKFGRVNMKPGKPMTLAIRGEHNGAVFALPGNPVSAFVCFHVFVAFAARIMAGCPAEVAKGKRVEATLNEELRLDPERPEFHRARLEWRDGIGYVAYSTGLQRSSRLLSACSVDALLLLPAQEGSFPAGTVVKALMLG